MSIDLIHPRGTSLEFGEAIMWSRPSQARLEIRPTDTDVACGRSSASIRSQSTHSVMQASGGGSWIAAPCPGSVHPTDRSDRPAFATGFVLRGLPVGCAAPWIRARRWDRGSGHVFVAVPAAGGEGGRRSCERCDVSDLDGASERSCWIPVMVGPLRGFDVVQESSIGHCAEERS